LYFRGLPGDIVGVAPHDLNNPLFLVPYTFSGHLWFLQYLFLMSLVTLPLLLYLRSEGGQHWIKKLAGWSDRWGGVFLFAIPLAVVLIGLRSVFPGQMTWTDFIYYAVFFLIGYMIPGDTRFTESFKRHGWLCLGLWVAGFLVMVLFIAALGYEYLGIERFSLSYVVFQVVLSVTNLSGVVFMLSLGAKYLNFNNRILGYANEAVLPFYVLHQTIILAVGWFVIRWDMGILPKFLIISVVSFALIMLLYELLVRRFNVVRFLFGMRARRKTTEVSAVRPEGTAA
jgi:surface polysaccharide O-acyltransferase-like enzyme